jgi:hypothetical protein
MCSTDVLLFAFSDFSRLRFAIAPDLAARVERPEWYGSCVAARSLRREGEGICISHAGFEP